MANEVGYTKEDIEALLLLVHSKVITAINLPKRLYLATVERLSDAIFDGFGGDFADFSDDPLRLRKIREYHRNIQVFSGAKTHQQVVDMTKALFDEAGRARDFNSFKKLANGIFDTYNDVWLKVEMNTAINTTQGAQIWLDALADADIVPNVIYQTVGDERVRPQHVVLEGIVKPVGDPFWDMYWPPNGWNCRCTVDSIEADERPISKETVQDFRDADELPPRLFRRNPGKSRFVFDENVHPYFRVDQRFEVLKDNNFNLPLDDRTDG